MLGRARAAFERARARANFSRPQWILPAVDDSEPVLAIHPPEFLGVSISTQRCFRSTLPIASNVLLARSARESLWAAIEDASPRAVVLSGFVDGYEEFVRGLHVRRPDILIRVLWHGTPMQLADPDERRQYDCVLKLAGAGIVSRIGTLKTGEALGLVARGIDATDVFNPPPDGSPSGLAPKLRADDTKVGLGIFAAGSTWRKNPYAMLTAAARIPDVEIHGVLDRSAQSYARSSGLHLAKVQERAWSTSEIATHAETLDLNLYVGLSECSPLFPLESLHLGVPCLVGPNSHLFLESPLLFTADDRAEDRARAESAARVLERLVVSRADDPTAIARAIEDAVGNRGAIQAAYRDWRIPYGRAARESVARFVDLVSEESARP